MRLQTDRHLDDAEIEKYSLGSITEEEASRFEEHLLICESCQGRVTASDLYVSAMQSASSQIRQEVQANQRHRWFSRPSLVPTFAAAVLVLLLAVAWGNGWQINRRSVEPAYAVNLTATRGNGIEAKAPTGRALTLQLDLAGLSLEPSLRLEIVGRLGHRVWEGTVFSQDSKAVASVPRMAGGLYFLRAYTPSGKLLREFGLEVEGR